MNPLESPCKTQESSIYCYMSSAKTLLQYAQSPKYASSPVNKPSAAFRTS
jgi:hypothetical protein